MSESQYLVGIDLGTSNCAMAFAEPSHGPDATVEDFPVLQLRRPGEVAFEPLLPSTLYQPHPQELQAEIARLPWGETSDWIAGEFARWQGARVSGRLIASAKSWLCHAGVDRSAGILPWGAPEEVRKISPVEASSRLLAHMASAWDHARPGAPLRSQEVVITVPASFDEVARGLTVAAVREAGLERFTLVEEPQAAFYDFTSRHRHDLAAVLQGVRVVLVVDVGGGTSDFTLVQVASSPEGPLMQRIAVGEHLMLGGDNMDAALSRRAEERMVSGTRRLSMAQWSQLTQSARIAKEILLGQNPPDHYNVSVASEGSRLVGSTLSARLTRAETEDLVLEGFLPRSSRDEWPRKPARVALQEIGLPYAQDAAITRHLAAFLRAHAEVGFAALGVETAAGGLPRPDAILLNGGVFNSPRITERLLSVVSQWWQNQPPIRLLQHDSLERAVARGAAYYGLVRRGLGRRITGGAAHAIYIGLQKPGDSSPMALCVVPRGHEEGEPIDLSGKTFQLALGKPVRFPLYSTAADRFERPGQVVALSDDLQPLPAIHTLLKGTATGTVPVHLRAMLTEIGTLELWCVSEPGRERWRLEFELRGRTSEGVVTETESIPASFAEARKWIDLIYGAKPGKQGAARAGEFPGPPRDVKQLWASLERSLGPREEWRLPVLRELWGAVFAGAGRRRRSADHERIFFQLAGYTLRPGFGYALDEWRSEEMTRLFPDAVEFHREKAVWKEFWILWRRVAGGLNPKRHGEIWAYLKPHLALRLPPKPPPNLVRPKGVQPEDLDEMTRLAASLEHLPASDKSELGDWIAARLTAAAGASGPWTWALGRLGTRVPIYGSVHGVVPPEKATQWAGLLMEPKLRASDGALFGLAQIGRLTGDRTRDLDPVMRGHILEVMEVADISPSWIRMVREVTMLATADRARALGDTLPVGLTLA